MCVECGISWYCEIGLTAFFIWCMIKLHVAGVRNSPSYFSSFLFWQNDEDFLIGPLQVQRPLFLPLFTLSSGIRTRLQRLQRRDSCVAQASANLDDRASFPKYALSFWLFMASSCLSALRNVR